MSMPCPVDATELVIADRAGIEIDWCPTCRGVWLDRGELDKIVERTSPDARPSRPDRRGPRDDRYGGDTRHRDNGRGRRGFDDDDDDVDSDRSPRGRRRSSLLGDLFDFG